MALQMQSTVKREGKLELGLVEVDVPEPREGEVLVRVEAAPINPSDLGLMFGGADLVTVVAAGTAVPAPHGVRVVRVRTSAEMSEALGQRFEESELLVMAAAVSDFRPAKRSASKVKGDSLELALTRTEDILATLGAKKGRRLIVGFALETDDLEANAMEKLRKKNCDLMVLNDPREEGAAFAHDTNVVTIYGADGEVYKSDGPEPKRAVARKIMELVAALRK